MSILWTDKHFANHEIARNIERLDKPHLRNQRVFSRQKLDVLLIAWIAVLLTAGFVAGWMAAILILHLRG